MGCPWSLSLLVPIGASYAYVGPSAEKNRPNPPGQVLAGHSQLANVLLVQIITDHEPENETRPRSSRLLQTFYNHLLTAHSTSLLLHLLLRNILAQVSYHAIHFMLQPLLKLHAFLTFSPPQPTVTQQTPRLTRPRSPRHYPHYTPHSFPPSSMSKAELQFLTDTDPRFFRPPSLRGPPTMSPRRSSRARSSQQPPSGPNHTSSTSSNSGKLDRDIRSHNRTNSPRPPSTQRSESVDGVDSSSRSDQIAPRRSRRNGEDKEAVLGNPLGDDDIDIDPTEEEVTRCICEQSEYPGPSVANRQNAPQAESLTEETGNFFVQCDSCSVWQHGGCMGLLDESMLPEEYYCELCKPRFHKITKNANGYVKLSTFSVALLEMSQTFHLVCHYHILPLLHQD